MLQNIAGVLYITYDGLCDPLGQSQILPYLIDLAKKNIKIVILSFEKRESFKKTNLFGEIKQILRQNRIKWKHLKYHKKPYFPATLYDVIYGYINGIILINKYRLNIVHARGYISAFIAYWLKKSTGIKFIFDMRGFWVEEKVDAGFWSKKDIGYKLAKSLEKAMLRSADRIVVLTEKARLFLASQIPKDNDIIEVIPTCVDLDNFKPTKGFKKNFLQDKLVVLYSGSIGTFYGFRDAINFFKILYDKQPYSFFLALINNQPDMAVKILKTEGVSQDAYIVLSLPHTQTCSWLRDADISLMFYHRDNSYRGCCPTKLGESLACGVPVLINSGIGDTEEIIKKERVGVIINEFSDNEYGKAIEELRVILSEGEELRERCRFVAGKYFSLPQGVNKYQEIYLGLLTN